jgi:hypothetical protein
VKEVRSNRLGLVDMQRNRSVASSEHPLMFEVHFINGGTSRFRVFEVSTTGVQFFAVTPAGFGGSSKGRHHRLNETAALTGDLDRGASRAGDGLRSAERFATLWLDRPPQAAPVPATAGPNELCGNWCHFSVRKAGEAFAGASP